MFIRHKDSNTKQTDGQTERYNIYSVNNCVFLKKYTNKITAYSVQVVVALFQRTTSPGLIMHKIIESLISLNVKLQSITNRHRNC